MYKRFGLTALARKRRTDASQQREMSAKLKEAIEGIALQKPPIPVAAVCRQARRLAEDLGEEPPRVHFGAETLLVYVSQLDECKLVLLLRSPGIPT